MILVTNSYGESWVSSWEKYWVPVQKQWVPDKKKKLQAPDWKCLGLCVTRQLIWLISLTDSKTLYYCSTLKSKYSPSKGQKKYASFNNSHNNCHRIHKRDTSTNTHVQIFYGSLRPLECMPWILLFCIFGDFYASGMQDAEVNKVTAYFLYGQEIIRRFCFKM